MKILISGDRKWSDSGLIKETLNTFNTDNKPTICYYVKPGASLLAKHVAESMGFETQAVENLKGIDLLIVFHKYIRGSIESKLLIKEAVAWDIPYQVVGSNF